MISKSLSIIIPTKNEKDNISPLLQRIASTLETNHINYEVIFIDDFSTDGTETEIKKLVQKYPVSFYKKITLQGKARSLIEGFARSKFDYVAMIDADLQYPPESIIKMLNKLNRNTDIVVANRTDKKTSTIRKVTSRLFNKVFCNFLHGLDLDVQSGLKVFKKEILNNLDLNPSPWAFDLEFLTKAVDAGYKITTVDIPFLARPNGKSKINLVSAAIQNARSAVALKFRKAKIYKRTASDEFHFRGRKFNSYSKLHIDQTAIYNLTKTHALVLLTLLLTFSTALAIDASITLILTMAAISVIYFSDLLFNLFLIYRGFAKEPELTITNTQIMTRVQWPLYTILCPLYNEWQVLPQFIKAIGQLDYPKDKLQVLLLLEENDTDTINKAKFSNLPEYFQIVLVPDSKPKTKPKALNYGLRLAKGLYTVVYDAEDIPEPAQLKKAVVAQEITGDKIACIQAKLNFYNPKQNLLTRLFTAEYSLWFDLVLTGLQSVHAPIPLGGTSNHFKTQYLKEIKGWDSFNVTEDCDLGMRITKQGHHTAIINSTTFEEANSELKNWFDQRTRWIKGYMQTYLVHMRTPHLFTRSIKRPHLIIFQLVVGGKVASMIINSVMWSITLCYFIFRTAIGSKVETLFPGPVLYLAIICLVFGNFLYAYYYMLGCAKRGHFELVKYVFLIPLYWLAMSLAAYVALYQLIKKPHYWAKTKHGLHLTDKVQLIKAGLLPKSLLENFIALTGNMRKL